MHALPSNGVRELLYRFLFLHACGNRVLYFVKICKRGNLRAKTDGLFRIYNKKSVLHLTYVCCTNAGLSEILRIYLSPLEALANESSCEHARCPASVSWLIVQGRPNGRQEQTARTNSIEVAHAWFIASRQLSPSQASPAQGDWQFRPGRPPERRTGRSPLNSLRLDDFLY